VKKCTGPGFEGFESNMIGYEMGFSSGRVYTMAKTFPVENFKHK
jgi:hypothetical protein